MALDGAGTRFVSSCIAPSGNPGGTLFVTLEIQPLGSYPALGEFVSDLFAHPLIGGKVKVPPGVKPDNFFASGPGFGGGWTFDPTQGTMGGLRFATGAVEHGTAVYTAGELASLYRITFLFPLYRTTSN